MTTASTSNDSVSLCLINYNGERYLQDTLQAVYAQSTVFEELVLMDNASQDNSLSLVRRNFPEVRIVCLPRNMGPGPARNAGLQAIAGRRILFIDNDVLLSRACVAQLMHVMERHPGAAAAMPRVIHNSDRSVIQYDGAYSHYLGHMILSNADTPLDKVDNEPYCLDSIVTACFLFDRTKWPDNNPFDDALPIYYEDHDFGLRLRVAGNQIVAVPSAHVFHGEGTRDLSFRRGGTYHPVRIRNLVLNRWQILLKNFTSRTLILTLPMLLVYEVFQLVGLAKKGWLKQWAAAFRQISANRDGIAARRRYVQSLRQVADRSILQGGPIPFTTDLTGSAAERLFGHMLDFLSIWYWRCIRRML